MFACIIDDVTLIVLLRRYYLRQKSCKPCNVLLP